MTKELTDDEALVVTVEVIYKLLLEGINTITLTTVNDETIKVHITKLTEIETKAS